MEFGIPKRYEGARDPLDCRDRLLPPVRNYYADIKEHFQEGRGFILAGANGVGKTWTAVALARAASRAVGRDPNAIVFCNSAMLFETIYPMSKQPYIVRDWDDTLDHVVESCRILILDDFGHEIRSKVTGSKINRLLRHRGDACRYTLITTNLHLRDGAGGVAATCGASAASLIDELCPYQVDVTESADERSLGVFRVEV